MGYAPANFCNDALPPVRNTNPARDSIIL